MDFRVIRSPHGILRRKPQPAGSPPPFSSACVAVGGWVLGHHRIVASSVLSFVLKFTLSVIYSFRLSILHTHQRQS